MGRPDLKPCPRQCTVWPNAAASFMDRPSGYTKCTSQTHERHLNEIRERSERNWQEI